MEGKYLLGQKRKERRVYTKWGERDMRPRTRVLTRVKARMTPLRKEGLAHQKREGKSARNEVRGGQGETLRVFRRGSAGIEVKKRKESGGEFSGREVLMPVLLTGVPPSVAGE